MSLNWSFLYEVARGQASADGSELLCREGLSQQVCSIDFRECLCYMRRLQVLVPLLPRVPCFDNRKLPEILGICERSQYLQPGSARDGAIRSTKIQPSASDLPGFASKKINA